MQSGLLTGSFSAERAEGLPKDDWRSRNAEFTGDKLIANLQLTDAFRPIAEGHGTSVAAVAVAWTLAWRGVTGAIVGARSPAQVDGWLDAATLELSPDEMLSIYVEILSTGAGSGPALPSG
jgi:aryl-alcohol dehydrogenase-like predicted oxidoreductase